MAALRSNNRRSDPSALSPNAAAACFIAGIAIVGSALLWAAISVGYNLAGRDVELPDDPFSRVLYVLSGRLPWLVESTWMLAVLGGVVALMVCGSALVVRRRRRTTTRIDRFAQYLGTGSDISSLSAKAAKKTASRLGVPGAIGVPIGAHLPGGALLYGSWEDMHVDIWGPRTGKTTSRAIPAILDAPGACIVTSNKRDIVDASRGPRAERAPVWVFDPQGIATEPASWYWDPLSYVTDEVKAAKLAEHFASGSRSADAKTDAFFDPAGQDLLAGLLLAAALDKRPITDVYTWLTRPTETEPVTILEHHGFSLTADQVSGVINAPDKQRGGIYGTAQQMASSLTNRSIVRWITQQPGDQRNALDVVDFVRSGGTLYSLSKEGKGTAGPLVTALTVAVVEAAEEIATQSRNGRLPTPLVGVLDEAANVCRWRQLPDLYSHYGSRGIVLMTILQSWSQGVEVWGESGMRKLWSAANIKCYGGGVSETQFLDDLSKLVGEHDRLRTSISTGSAQRSASRQVQRERTLDVDALAAMPRGRALVIASGARPTLVRTRPWMTGPHAAKVRKSLQSYEPRVGMEGNDR